MKRPISQGPDDTEIAAEYVLRVLSPDAHRSAAMRAVTDPDFAAEVRTWEDRFAPMMEEVKEVTPHPATKSALMGRLFGNEPLSDTPVRSGIWQALAAIGFAAAAALAVIAFVPQTAPSDTGAQRFVAELTVADETTRMFAVFEAGATTVDIAWTARNQPEGRDLQLWALINGTDPVSIGVLPAGRNATLTIPAGLLDQTDGLVLAISEEPLGGSTTQGPSGQILATTPVSEI